MYVSEDCESIFKNNANVTSTSVNYSTKSVINPLELSTSDNKDELINNLLLSTTKNEHADKFGLLIRSNETNSKNREVHKGDEILSLLVMRDFIHVCSNYGLLAVFSYSCGKEYFCSDLCKAAPKSIFNKYANVVQPHEVLGSSQHFESLYLKNRKALDFVVLINSQGSDKSNIKAVVSAIYSKLTNIGKNEIWKETNLHLLQIVRSLAGTENRKILLLISNSMRYMDLNTKERIIKHLIYKQISQSIAAELNFHHSLIRLGIDGSIINPKKQQTSTLKDNVKKALCCFYKQSNKAHRIYESSKISLNSCKCVLPE